MLLGIDVGGTHTDCVLIKDGQIRAKSKVTTQEDNLLSSICQAMEHCLQQVTKPSISSFNLSTTLGINTIIKNQGARVAVIATKGPGLVLAQTYFSDSICLVDGVMDHCGQEIIPIKAEQIQTIIQKCKKEKISCFAVVGKFSPKNPNHENQIASLLEPYAEHITLGHRLSGRLNFPRRIATAYFNASIHKIFEDFEQALLGILKKFNTPLPSNIKIVKADGGTIPLQKAKQLPVETIFSGPAASIMGVLSSTNCQQDAIILDIGGTTTDIALLNKGIPLQEKDGAKIREVPTLVRSMQIKSTGIGGDSLLTITEDKLQVGPTRLGPCMAQGGPAPTLMDACNVAGICNYGDSSASLKSLQKLGKNNDFLAKQLAEHAINIAADNIYEQSMAFLNQINSRPVYTIHELLADKKIKPQEILIMGGPARILAPVLEKRFALPVKVVPNSQVANAIGAALTKPTEELELFADTSNSIMSIPRLGIKQKIDKNFDIEQAINLSKDYLIQDMKQKRINIQENDIQVLEKSSFNMVDGFYTIGKNIRVRCQICPKCIKLNHI